MNILELGTMQKVLIFDFDGVIADSLAPMLQYAEQVCQELGHPCQPKQNDLESLERMEFSEFGRQLGIPETKIDVFVTRNHEFFYNRQEPLAIIAEMDDVIRKTSRIATLAIITGNSCKVVDKFLIAYELKDEFKTILCAEDEGNRAEKILRIKALHNGSNSEYYMIGDAISDIRAAQRAGIKSVAVGWGHQSKLKLATGNPDFIIDQPEDLIKLFEG
jgi:phosphoglycolate phosphatase